MNASRPTHAASAPVRLDFAGGWTDVPPFSSEEGGVVVAAAIGLRVQAQVRPAAAGEPGIVIIADDIGLSAVAAVPDQLSREGPLALLAAAVRRYPPPPPAALRTRSDVPPGSGLGSSGALDVAMVAALLAARGEHCGVEELANRAWQVEAADAGIAGGKQDQYIAALGGFQRMEFRDPAVVGERLAIDASVRDALAAATLLCYTGRSRLSGSTISRVIAAYERRDRVVTESLFGIREVAERMPAALQSGELDRIGAMLVENWRHQQALDPGMSTPEMAVLGSAVQNAGGLGGKAAGAGAGGCMFFIVSDYSRAAAAARAAGAEVLPVAWSSEGVIPC